MVDQYGKDRDKKRPLLLDAVMEGQERASHSRLLQMPTEILAEIIDLLGDSKSALANLALVSRDCRQLARTSIRRSHLRLQCPVQGSLYPLGEGSRESNY